MTKYSFKVEAADIGIRLDLFIAIKSQEISRSKVREILNSGKVRVDGEIEYRPQLKMQLGSLVEVVYEQQKKVNNKIIPQNIPLDIVYEDSDLLIINKPEGMVTQPATGNWQGTLVNALLYHYNEIRGLGAKERAGLINRIDKDTSGLVLVGKTSKALWYYTRLFAQREIQKTYLAVIVGNIEKLMKEKELIITNYLGRNPKIRTKFSKVNNENGRFSETRIKLIKTMDFEGKQFALLQVEPKTGRTHQIRVHLSGLGCPILGDRIYGKNNKFERMMLHAWKIKMRFLDGQEREVTAPIPKIFNNFKV
ncbi:MAG TPA: RluA family pseudouridine synthase [Candidatus Dojkabacteria bacterium]|nr:RluA family pseudouridine synthase [Candidatus Dojkabacteria bacterium]